MSLITIAYILLGLGIIIKTIGLYILSGKKNTPFEIRKKNYFKINWLANGILFIGVIIIIFKNWL